MLVMMQKMLPLQAALPRPRYLSCLPHYSSNDPDAYGRPPAKHSKLKSRLLLGTAAAAVTFATLIRVMGFLTGYSDGNIHCRNGPIHAANKSSPLWYCMAVANSLLCWETACRSSLVLCHRTAALLLMRIMSIPCRYVIFQTNAGTPSSRIPSDREPETCCRERRGEGCKRTNMSMPFDMSAFCQRDLPSL